MNYSELLQLAKGWGNFISGRIIIWRLRYEKVGFKERTLTENAFSFKDESWGRCNMITTR